MASTGHANNHLRETDEFLLQLYVQDVRDKSCRKRPFTFKPWSTIKDVKDEISKQMGVPPAAQHLFVGGPLQNYGRELPNHWTLNDAAVCKSGEVLMLEVRDWSSSSASFSLSPLQSGSLAALSPASRRLQRLQHRESDIHVATSMKDLTPKSLEQVVQKARRGLVLGLKPELVIDGSGGTYFLRDAHKVKVGVFKPSDEEPYAENNPRGYVNVNSSICGNSGGCDDDDDDALALRAGVKPGEACIREVAAYVLDHGGFSSVPKTTLVEANHRSFHNSGTRLKVYEGGAGRGSHSLLSSESSSSCQNLISSATPSYGLVMQEEGSREESRSGDEAVERPRFSSKIGSFQEFVRSECTMDDLSPSKISVDEVHKIAVLDIRMLNADRNVGNLLVRRRLDNSLQLVPIDHGFCLRSVCDIADFDWCWLTWKQLREPVSARTREYILSLDVEKDVAILRERFQIEKSALEYHRAATYLLQAGIRKGLDLYEIASMCCRYDLDGLSRLETAVHQASDLAASAVENGRWHHAAASRALADQLISSSPHMNAASSPWNRRLKSHGTMRRCASIASLHHKDDNDEEEEDTTPDSSPVAKWDTSLMEASASTPDSANTSGSESGGSSLGSCEDNDCNEWAAGIVADVSVDVAGLSTTPSGDLRRSRSDSSTSSDDSELGRSPPGFWMTRPGAASDSADATLSPLMNRVLSTSSSEESSSDAASMPNSPMPPLAPFTARTQRRVSFALVDSHSDILHADDSTMNNDMAPFECDGSSTNVSIITESPISPVPFVSSPDSVVVADDDDMNSPLAKKKDRPPPPPPAEAAQDETLKPCNLKMQRSQSYSAFSFLGKRLDDDHGGGGGASIKPPSLLSTSFREVSSRKVSGPSMVTSNHWQFLEYKIKFIELLLEQEILTALNQRKLGRSPDCAH